MEIEQEDESYQKFYDFLEESINKIKLQKPKMPMNPFMRFHLEKQI